MLAFSHPSLAGPGPGTPILQHRQEAEQKEDAQPSSAPSPPLLAAHPAPSDLLSGERDRCCRAEPRRGRVAEGVQPLLGEKTRSQTCLGETLGWLPPTGPSLHSPSPHCPSSLVFSQAQCPANPPSPTQAHTLPEGVGGSPHKARDPTPAPHPHQLRQLT